MNSCWRNQEEQAAKLKAENIRVALEKIKEAQVKKLVIRVHLSDESSKTMMVDERQTVRQLSSSQQHDGGEREGEVKLALPPSPQTNLSL
ncbi:hypothetical protein INR49_018897 [Caranx melampygus]|nr:hypothetical protein INR49_018897 [Caranx melampygus]